MINANGHTIITVTPATPRWNTPTWRFHRPADALERANYFRAAGWRVEYHTERQAPEHADRYTVYALTVTADDYELPGDATEDDILEALAIPCEWQQDHRQDDDADQLTYGAGGAILRDVTKSNALQQLAQWCEEACPWYGATPTPNRWYLTTDSPSIGLDGPEATYLIALQDLD